MFKSFISLVLTIVLIMSAFAVIPASALTKENTKNVSINDTVDKIVDNETTVKSLEKHSNRKNKYDFVNTGELVEINEDVSLYYEVKEDGTAVITGYDSWFSDLPEDFAIPSKIDGINVTEIGPFAFGESDSLSSVTIPDTITKIGSYAFEYCENLENVTILGKLTELGESVFDNTLFYIKLKDNTPENEGIYINDMLIGVNSFFDEYLMDSYINLKVKEGTRLISGGALNSYYIQTVVLPTSLKIICDGAFGFNDDISYIYYSGTKEQFNTISIGEENYVLHELNIIYNATGPKTYGDYKYVWYDTSVELIEYIGTGKTVTVPEKIDNLPVENFSTIFYSNTAITKVVLPNTIKEICYNAFSGCTSLEEINIPESVKSFGSFAFRNCTNLKKVSLPDGMTEIPYSFFSNCTSLSNINIPSTVTKLVYGCFCGCKSLLNIKLPDRLTYIDSRSFYDTGITEANIPSLVDSIGENCFGTSLVKYNVASNNSNYCSVDNVLYSKNKDIIVSYPSSKIDSEFSILDSVRVVADSAFSSPKYLSTLTINEGVEALPFDFISDDYKVIKTINFPSTLRVVTLSSYWSSKNIGLISTSWYQNLPEGVVYCGPVAAGYKGNPYSSTIIIKDGTKAISDCAFTHAHGATYDEAELSNDFIEGEIDLNIKDVVIGKDVETIGDYAFYGNSNLSSVTLKSGNPYVGCQAFYGTKWYDDLYLNANDGPFIIGGTVVKYKNYDNETEISLSEGIKCIDTNAFENCDKLKEIKLPNSLEIIGENAFRGTAIETLNIPRKVKSLGEDDYNRPFSDMDNLESVIVDKNNNIYSDIDGVLFDKEKSVLFCYPPKHSTNTFVMPDSVEKICSEAFINNQNIKTLKLSTNVKFVPNSMCENCSSLTTVELPTGLEYIEFGAFDGTKIISIDIPYITEGIYGLYGLENLTIRGFAGSEAESFAKEYEITFEEKLLGDSDNDGKISITDATVIQQDLSHLKSLSNSSLHSADADKDGRNSINDATKLQQLLAKLIPSL